MTREEYIKKAASQFERLLREQLERSDKMAQDTKAKDYTSLDTVIVGLCSGDGIGPVIMAEAQRLLNILLEDEIVSGKIVLREIEGPVSYTHLKVESTPSPLPSV